MPERAEGRASSTRSTWARCSPARSSAASSRSGSRACSRRSQKQPDAILFIDEIHTIVGAGATSGGSMDASNILKPALAVGQAALHRLDDVPGVQGALRARPRAGAPLPEDRGRRADASTRRSRSCKGLQAALRGAPRGRRTPTTRSTRRPSSSAKHINDRFLPDKAIDVIDEAGAADAAARREDARRTGSTARRRRGRWSRKMAQIPREAVSHVRQGAARRTSSRAASRSSSARTTAIEELVAAIKLSRSGLRAPEKPIGSFLFSGPTGVGKTELAKQLAQVARRRVPALRHERVHGEAHRLAPDRRAARATSASTRAACSPTRSASTRTRCWCSTRSRRRTRTSSTSCSR